MPQPIIVEAPDGTEVEFPAGTSREVMRSAMARRYPAQSRSAQAVQRPTSRPVTRVRAFMRAVEDGFTFNGSDEREGNDASRNSINRDLLAAGGNFLRGK
jgi:hypothetical protein